jgi:DNA modification methylase
MKKERRLTFRYMDVSELVPSARNPRTHDRAQIEAIAISIDVFGFNAPILVDKFGNVLAGHGRLEAAKLRGIRSIPVICLEDLSEAQARAYMIADNRLTDRSSWDETLLAVQLKELSDLALDFSIEATGFELPEIDLRIQSLEDTPDSDQADVFAISEGPAVSRPGDLWLFGKHRLLCGSALDGANHATLMAGVRAAAIFADPPFNLKISGHVSGLGAIQHREFAQASGEMTTAEFTRFLLEAFVQMRAHTSAGAVIYICMDFRHMRELIEAAISAQFELLNLCVWVKTNGGMGSFYRAKHELIFVFANGKGRRTNNIQLGRHGRNRTNVWNYAGANIPTRRGGENLLALHPTVKPIMLVADAIRDSTKRGELVLDPFIGSGTSILAAQRVGRRCYGMELDPLYVDTAIARWQRMTARQADGSGDAIVRLASDGRTFEQVRADRSEESHPRNAPEPAARKSRFTAQSARKSAQPARAKKPRSGTTGSRSRGDRD